MVSQLPITCLRIPRVDRKVPDVSALTIQLPAGLKSKLTATAKRLGKSPEQFIQETPQATLKNMHAPGLTLFDRSSDLCGTVNGEPTDLARNSKHLKGYGSWKR